ncbi:MAG: hypothetical protein IKF78_10505 [Atopobiaceae bacterium]|nr:hypothetical protein [Atopobiaceae bacterium]
MRIPLASFGKWSLIALCVHELEMYICPWQLLKNELIAFGLTDLNVLLALIACKLALIFAVTAILVHLRPVLWLFGYTQGVQSKKES